MQIMNLKLDTDEIRVGFDEDSARFHRLAILIVDTISSAHTE